MTSLSLVIHASANAANSWAPSQVRVGGQNQRGGSEVTDEATSAVAALQMSVVHHANIRRTILNKQVVHTGFDTVLGGKKLALVHFH